MARNATPLDLMQTATTLWWLTVETQMVMAYRMMGMAGLWSVTPSEDGRMVSEKGPAFAKAMMAGTQAMMTGKRPDEVMLASARPLRRKTRSNVRRLSKRGPQIGPKK